MKKAPLIISLLICYFLNEPSFAQKQDRIWLFPDGAGIDFNDLNNPIAITSNIHDPDLASFGSISDSLGNLLFYFKSDSLNFNSGKIYNSQNNLLINGTGLLSYPLTDQSCIILPDPLSSNKYYVILTSRTGLGGNRISYNIVDMSSNGGAGSVISKNNILIPDFISEKLVAVKHANGRDWWLITQSNGIDRLYYKILFSNESFRIDTQSIGGGNNINRFFGQMCISKDGSIFAVPSYNASFELYNFDRCNGRLSDYVELGDTISTKSNHYWGCSISPNNRFLYTSSYSDSAKYVYQFDLQASNIRSSRQTIFTYPNTGLLYGIFIGHHLLGPDDKIYIAKGGGPNFNSYYTHHLDVILSPDSFGTACNYDSCHLDLGTGYTWVSLPNMPNYNLGPVTGSVCDSLSTGIDDRIDKQGKLFFYPNPASDLIKFNIETEKRIQVMIYDQLGRMIHHEFIYTNESINIFSLLPGVYTIRIVLDGKELQQKLIKIKND